jgi:hypothetical protein
MTATLDHDGTTYVVFQRISVILIRVHQFSSNQSVRSRTPTRSVSFVTLSFFAERYTEADFSVNRANGFRSKIGGFAQLCSSLQSSLPE